MPKGLITYSTLSDIADAIRSKLKTQNTYLPEDMAAAILSIPTGGDVPDIVPFSSGTDEEIVAMIQAAHAGIIDLQQDANWAVGDSRTISISSFTSYYWGNATTILAQNMDIVISSFDEYMNCGNVLQFDFKNSINGQSSMTGSETSSNVGGYGATKMKTDTLPNLVNALPEWLKEMLIEFSVLSSEGSGSSNIVTVSGNKLALRSEVEIYGTYSASYEGEGSQVQYYTTNAHRTKYRNSYADRWFTRSPVKNNSNNFACVNGDGTINDKLGSANSYGVSPFGCI